MTAIVSILIASVVSLKVSVIAFVVIMFSLPMTKVYVQPDVFFQLGEQLNDCLWYLLC